MTSYLDRRHGRFDGATQPGAWLPEYKRPQVFFMYDTVFILPAKTGCTTIRHAINSGRDLLEVPLQKPVTLNQAELEEKAKKYPTIMTVRHPYERVVSAFFNKFEKQFASFKTFLEEVIQVPDIYADIHIQSMSFLSNGNNVDRIIRQEDMQEDYNKAREVAPWLHRVLPHANATGTGTKWKNYITPDEEGALYTRYREDFENFNYEV